MEDEWGTRREDYYADDSDDSEEDEYNEILKLEGIRAKKMKLAQVTLHDQPNTQEEAKKTGDPSYAITEVKLKQQINELPKAEDLPKNISQSAYGKDLMEEYEKVYDQIVNGNVEDKYGSLKRSTLMEYANALQRLIQTKSQNLEGNDIIEEIINYRAKLEELQSIEAADTSKKVVSEPVKEIPKVKKVKKIKEYVEEVKEIPKSKKKTLKTSLIVGRNKNLEQEVEENESKLIQRGKSYLEDYLTSTIPNSKEKLEDKVIRKKKQRRIANLPLPTEEDDFYKQILKEKEEAKERKLERIKTKKEEKKEQANEKFSIAQRNVNYNILKAKGLTRKRKKSDRNSRVKLRRKYDKAVKLRRVIFIFNSFSVQLKNIEER